jgi:hypothetical protein
LEFDDQNQTLARVEWSKMDFFLKSMQEVEASTLEIGIAQGINDSSSSKELLVLVSCSQA